MADKKAELKVVENKKKEPWTVKRILTTVVIAILSLLMIGGLYYVVVMIQQDKDTSNVFGYYDGEPIKLAYNTVFYNTLLADENFINASESGDYNALFSSYSMAYQAELVHLGLNKMAEDAGILAPEKLVNKQVIASGRFKNEDGSKLFDPEVYDNTPMAERSTVYSYYENIYPSTVVSADLSSTIVTTAENEFVSKLASNARDFEYFVVNYNAYPDNLALEYDISGMNLSTDTDGNVIQPSTAEIKSYMYSVEPELFAEYIESAVAEAGKLAPKDFALAAKAANAEVVPVAGAVNNFAGSSYFGGIAELDTQGYLAAALTEELSKRLFTEGQDYLEGSIELADGSYVFVRISSEASEASMAYISALMYQYYATSQVYIDNAQSFLESDLFEDNFMNAFWGMLFNGVASVQ